ncbi:hypothetical protein WJX82_005590 [Trebouxia sp. C0006]
MATGLGQVARHLATFRYASCLEMSFFEKYHQSAQELYSELCHQLVTLPAQDKELIKVAPAYGQFNITLPDKSKLTLKALLPREWSRVCSMYWQVLTTGQDLQLAHQSQARWQPGCASIRSELSSPVYLPMTMEVCSALMRAITTYLLAVDAFAESDEDVAAAVAFAAQVLQIPLEYVKQSVAAGNVSPVKKMSASSEADVAKNPEGSCGPSKADGQGARETTSASQEMQAEMREVVVKFSTEDVMSWCMPWQNLYLTVTQVARCRQASGASVLVKQACQDSQAPAAEAHMPLPLVALCIELLESSLEHLCHAAMGSPGINMVYISALLDAVPDACASSADTKQPLMKAVAACIQLVDHVTDRRTTLLLEAAWKAVIVAFNTRSMLQLTQDMTRDFWGNSGVKSELSTFDVSIVESALASLEDHSKMLASKETMSAALLTIMSAMPAMSDSSSLELEPDAGPADPPHTADAMAEGDSADAVAKVALAPAQAEAVVNTQTLLGPSKLNSGWQGEAQQTCLQSLCKLRPSSSDAEPLGPLESRLSEAEEETQAKNQKLPSKLLQATHANAGTARDPSSKHHAGHAAQAAQGAEEKGDNGKGGLRLLPGTVIETKQAKASETANTALQHEIQPADCIKSVADALNRRDQSSQPDGSKPRGEPRHCQQAGCSSPAGTEVQVHGTQPQAREEPGLQSSSPKCFQGQITLDQQSQAMLPLNTQHREPSLLNQACLPCTTNCPPKPSVSLQWTLLWTKTRATRLILVNQHTDLMRMRMEGSLPAKTSVYKEPRQHPEGTGTSTEDMQVHAKWLVQAELASSSTLRTQDISAGSELVQQILQAINIDAKEILPEAGKQALCVASLVLEKAYANGYKDAKHEVAEHCMKTSG